MSQRVIDDPAAAGWELNPDTGYWMWKGEEGTGGLWEQNGDDIYYEDGNVGIGTSDFPYNGTRLYIDGGDVACGVELRSGSDRLAQFYA